MTRSELARLYEAKVKEIPYHMIYYKKFKFSRLDRIMFIKRAGRGTHESYNDILIMADTETSKKSRNIIKDGKYIPVQNHVVAWTISLRAYGYNIATLYGSRPDELAECFEMIHNHMHGDKTIVYWHNMSYDWVFVRKFFLQRFGIPESQLSTKPHYPIYISWEHIIIKDSLILAQRSLEKWAKDLDVAHQKAVGKWDYDKLRNQADGEPDFSEDELLYIENDTLAGVECLQKTMDQLHKHIYSIPYTATGIPREDVRKIGSENDARDEFLRMAATYDQQMKMELIYHGGYTHGNRHLIEQTITFQTDCCDFCSSYPYQILVMDAPIEKFYPVDNCDLKFILRNVSKYAYMFKLILIKPRMKSDSIPMPCLQFSKCTKTINPVIDNGRILCAAYAEIYINEIDAGIIADQMDYDVAICVEVECAKKGKLPKWFRDYVYECFRQKTLLKGGDPVAYAMAKAKVNSLYGMCVQHPIRDDLIENFETGQYEKPEDIVPAPERYEKYINNHNSILPYAWGVWVTSSAMAALFELGKCVDYAHGGQWVYSDTDSIYANKWDWSKVEAYNNKCKERLLAEGYGPVLFNNREYWLGIAEHDGENDEYTEFRVMGAKRYCGRCKADGELHLTVAGVPKKAVSALKNDINAFTAGFIFPGSISGKKTHSYIFVDEIYMDDNGNLTGDSIDLTPCDYLLDSVNSPDWERIFYEEIYVQAYEEEDIK